MGSIKRRGIKHTAVSLFVFFVAAFAFEGYAQQPPERTGRPQLLQQKLYGPHGLQKRLLAQKVQATKPVAPPSVISKCTPSCDELLAKARQQGLMSVVITLNLPNLPDIKHVPKQDLLTERDVRMAAINKAQDRFLQRMRAHKMQHVQKGKLAPDLAMNVDAAAIQTIIADPEVSNIHESQILRLMLSQSVPLIGANQAWANGFSGAGYTIAILDTGVDSSHPFLAGKVVHEACYSGTAAGSTSLCPNGQTAVVGPGVATPCTLSGCDHGTHVAGIAAGTGSTFSGVAKDARIIAIQVFSQFPGGIGSPRRSD